ncbi:MAG TPA: response regulator [Vicinamibacteria bacterium]|nr:response regulator [Vicinamibacteria bacterium]
MDAAPDARPAATSSSRRPSRRPRALDVVDRRKQRTVLVVDDLTDQRELYAGYLRYLGYHVEEAASGVEAIAKAIDVHPDIVIMDLAMPGLDGFDATRVLKAITLTKQIPIVALTAHADHLPREWAAIAGCEAYLRKPILPGDLASEIERILIRRRSS